MHDQVRPKREPVVQRFIEITGRLSALLVGTVAIEMIMRGLMSWFRDVP